MCKWKRRSALRKGECAQRPSESKASIDARDAGTERERGGRVEGVSRRRCSAERDGGGVSNNGGGECKVGLAQTLQTGMHRRPQMAEGFGAREGGGASQMDDGRATCDVRCALCAVRCALSGM